MMSVDEGSQESSSGILSINSLIKYTRRRVNINLNRMAFHHLLPPPPFHLHFRIQKLCSLFLLFTILSLFVTPALSISPSSYSSSTAAAAAPASNSTPILTTTSTSVSLSPSPSSSPNNNDYDLPSSSSETTPSTLQASPTTTDTSAILAGRKPRTQNADK